MLVGLLNHDSFSWKYEWVFFVELEFFLAIELHLELSFADHVFSKQVLFGEKD